ncbi:MAG: hypothetical protein MUF42_15525 [Cytophagaceae bacterium]|nr:hypothetical protein [Cytophagaceae bacterium]
MRFQFEQFQHTLDKKGKYKAFDPFLDPVEDWQTSLYPDGSESEFDKGPAPHMYLPKESDRIVFEIDYREDLEANAHAHVRAFLRTHLGTNAAANEGIVSVYYKGNLLTYAKASYSAQSGYTIMPNNPAALSVVPSLKSIASATPATTTTATTEAEGASKKAEETPAPAPEVSKTYWTHDWHHDELYIWQVNGTIRYPNANEGFRYIQQQVLKMVKARRNQEPYDERFLRFLKMPLSGTSVAKSTNFWFKRSPGWDNGAYNDLNPDFLDKAERNLMTQAYDKAGTGFYYIGYVFDPNWGKKVEEEANAKYRGDAVNKKGSVSADKGIRLHATPLPADKQYVDKTGDSAKIYPEGSKLTILHRGNQENPGWVYIRTEDGKEGWIQDVYIQEGNESIPSPQRFGTYQVKQGDSASKIVQNQLNIARETGYDDRTFVHALYLLNKNKGVTINQEKYLGSLRENQGTNALDPRMARTRAVYQSVEVKEGAVLLIPDKAYIDDQILKGNIGSRPEWMNTSIAVGKGIYGFYKGVAEGFVEAGVGAVEDLWNLLKDIITGELFVKIAEGIEKMLDMSWDDFKEMFGEMLGGMLDGLEKWWKSGNPEKKWEAVGKIIGAILFEVVLAIVSGGTVNAIKNTGKFAKVFKLIDKVNDTVNGPINKAKAKIKEKLPKIKRKGDVPEGKVKGIGNEQEVKDLANKDKNTPVEDDVREGEPDAASKKAAFSQAISIVEKGDRDDWHPSLLMPLLWPLTAYKGVRGFSYDPMNPIGPFDIYMHGSKKKLNKKKKYDIKIERKDYYKGKIEKGKFSVENLNTLENGSKSWLASIEECKKSIANGEKFQVKVKSSSDALEFLSKVSNKKMNKVDPKKPNLNRYKAHTNSQASGDLKYEKG